MLAARRIAERYYPYIGETVDEPGDEFNVDATPHWVDEETHTFDTPAEMVETIRRDYVTFDATGRADWAAEPDGSHDIDFATGERERISWHFFPTMPMSTWLFVVAFVDARIEVRPNEYGGQSVVRKAGPQHVLNEALIRARNR